MFEEFYLRGPLVNLGIGTLALELELEMELPTPLSQVT